MLKTRILTALVLLAVFVPAAIFLPDWGWTILMSAVIGVAAWEWAGLAQFGQKARLAYGLGLFVCLTTFWFNNRMMWVFLESVKFSLCYAVIVLAFWFVAVPLWFRYRWSLKGVVGLIVGLFVLIPAWAFVTGGIDTNVLNRTFCFFIMAIAWVADIGAYFVGRKFGKHKLAPTISPGKTWEGVAGGFMAVFLYLCIMTVVLGTPSGKWVFLYLLLAAVLTAACVLGDLFESLLKRQANVKDSSHLLPGHGGVLDRIDSMLAMLGIFIPLVVLEDWLKRLG
ncbi:MAG: phosphatidate cytidylyltransferase [Zoogloeaceae bacterium]|jgi:phosphatidate cytidylyltransferase|nr:phosphatidate cytidylyltransferase [Zoogloeaceae bacterium]